MPASGSPIEPLPTFIPGLTARESCLDALHRALEALDTNSAPLMRSAWTREPSSLSSPAVFDMTRMTSDPSDIVTGMDAIVPKLLTSIGSLDTQHFVTNVRLLVDESNGTARMTAYALAQHKRPGQGGDPGAGDFLAGIRYWAEFVREEAREGNGEGGAEWWVIKRFVLGPQWAKGDFGIMQGK